MNKLEIIDALLNNGDGKEANKMAQYMKNNFEFLGIPASKRKPLTKSFLKQSKQEPLDCDFILECFKKKYREYQYLAIDYLDVNKDKLEINNIGLIFELTITRSWWDSVDMLDGIAGYLVLKYPTLKTEMIRWSKEENIWLKRVAIDHQLTFKEKTDQELLKTIIENNLDSNEFFVNKAIGWSLREYSKTNKEFVKNFIESHKSQLSALSIREGSKYL